MRRLALASVLVLAASAAAADPPRLRFPVDCEPGRDCWVFQYFDHDDGPGRRDFACGKRSYDGHTGTDIAVGDLAAVRRGVPVVAAAPGVVRAVRDGMPDRLFDPDEPGAAAGKGCGNGVAIVHDDGWETQYCHLRQGSVRVEQGQRVAAGDALGMVGLSGKTAFPHLELIVRQNGEAVDPFVGPEGAAEGCRLGAGHLWDAASLEEVEYSPVDIMHVGFAAAVPKPADAYAGKLEAETLPASASALVAWTTLAAVRDGDVLTLRLVAPDGRIMAESRQTLKRDQIRYFAYVGDRRGGEPWKPGTYRAEVRLERSGEPPVTRTATDTVTVR